MQELSLVDCEQAGGGLVPLVIGAIAAANAIINNSGSLYDFFSGVFDGYGDIR